MYKLCVFPLLYSLFSPSCFPFYFFPWGNKEIWPLLSALSVKRLWLSLKNSVLAKYAFQTLLRKLFWVKFKHQERKNTTWKTTGNKKLLFFLFGVLSHCKMYWKIFAFCGMNGNRVYKWAYTANTASTVAHPHISIYVLLRGLLSENHVYFALLCSL